MFVQVVVQVENVAVEVHELLAEVLVEVLLETLSEGTVVGINSESNEGGAVGLLNGIGGHVHPGGGAGESQIAAMRHFRLTLPGSGHKMPARHSQVR